MNAQINGKTIEFQEGETILQAAKRSGHFIPSLCEMSAIDHRPGTCRVCLVEIRRKGASESVTVTSCTTPVEDGLEVWTRTPAIREKQRLQVELLLADHNQDCAACIRHGDCELQDVAQFVGLQDARFSNPIFFSGRTKDESSPSIVRDMTKCIRCFRCVQVCRQVQGTDILVIKNEGLDSEVGVRHAPDMAASDCVSCGQCTLVCPVGALAEKDDTERVVDYLYDPKIVSVFQFAPAVRVALGEEFGYAPGTNVEGKIISALKKLGANVVLDTNFTADLVIMEEGTELLNRVKNGGVLPLFTSCSPGWINYLEKFHPDMLKHVSSTKSPQQCFGAIAKSYLAERMKVDPRTMRVVSIMPCTAKKGEAGRGEFANGGQPDVDVVLTTREFARLLKREGIHLADLPDAGFDNEWMGAYTGAAEIFGATGGVMEAALRTVHFVVTGKELEGVRYEPVRGLEGVKEAEVEVGALGTVRLAVAHGLKNALQIVEAVRNGSRQYHFVEVMTCPGGCIGGGGQPKSKRTYQGSRVERMKATYAIDDGAKVRQSHNNPLVQKLYKEFLGEPNSHKAHDLLHTHYQDRSRKVTHTMSEIWEDIEEGRVVCYTQGKDSPVSPRPASSTDPATETVDGRRGMSR
jgi:ferredoxin hydrogenase gamma subunit